MDPRYMDNLEKNTFKPCTPTMKKKKKSETKGCVLSLLNLVSLLSVEKELGWGERLVQHAIFGSYHLTLRFLWKNKVWFFGSENGFKTSICIMHSLDQWYLAKFLITLVEFEFIFLLCSMWKLDHHAT